MFRTELPLTPHTQQLPLSARVLTVGSCFSDSIGHRLDERKVRTLVNPFGTVFNPLSACKLLRAAAGEDHDWQQHVVEARGRWQSYDLHAAVGADSPVKLLQRIQQLLRDTGVFLVTADVVVLTLGTAWVYRLKETGELVSNCHKIPAERFEKELLTPDEIINAVAETHAYLRQRNPKLRFVLTVSPVRHLKDTLPLNAVSKSVLRVACHYLSELLPDVTYFPAYELLLDDLRDYRFYAADMLHPSAVAEDHIWERFARTYFDVEFGRFRKEWDAVRQALHHRPLYPAAPEHRQFLEQTLERLERLAGQADLRLEILDVRRRIEQLPLPKPKPAPEPEPLDDEERIDIGEGAEPYAPVQTEWRAPAPLPTPADLAEEEAYALAASEAADTADAAHVAEPAEAAPRKKRRSRGGAKRNKKKHAARLAAEAAAQEAGTQAAANATTQETAIEAEVPAEAAVAASSPGTLTSDLPVAPPVVITASDLPLQTLLARRKRNSRRSRGKKPGPDADTGNVADAASPASAAAPEAAVEPVEPLPAAVPAAPDESVSTGTPPANSNEEKPGRTGRSAREKRAAAVRKPHRPAARGFKPLYAGGSANDTPAEDAVGTPPEASVPAPPAGEAPTTQAPAVAAGHLNAAGKATRTRAPRPSAAVPTSSETAPTEPDALPAAIQVPSSGSASAAPTQVETPAPPPMASKRGASRRSTPAATDAPAAAEVAPVQAPTATRSRRQKSAAAPAKEATPTSETPTGPRRRKPTTPPASAEAAATTPPKRPRRTARRKPNAAADDSPAPSS